MTHESDRKQRRKKRKRWQQRGGGGMQRKGGVRSGGRGALSKASPFWQAVIGIATIAVVVTAVGMILLGIFGVGG